MIMTREITGIPKNFDELLEALVHTLQQQAQPVTGLDLAQLTSDLTAERTERQQDIELTAKARSFHQEFGDNQTQRYKRFRKAIQVLRAINIDHPEMLKALLVFKRTHRKSSQKQDQAA
jgi:hypothetical protein